MAAAQPIRGIVVIFEIFQAYRARQPFLRDKCVVANETKSIAWQPPAYFTNWFGATHSYRGVPLVRMVLSSLMNSSQPCDPVKYVAWRQTQVVGRFSAVGLRWSEIAMMSGGGLNGLSFDIWPCNPVCLGFVPHLTANKFADIEMKLHW